MEKNDIGGEKYLAFVGAFVGATAEEGRKEKHELERREKISQFSANIEVEEKWEMTSCIASLYRLIHPN